MDISAWLAEEEHLLIVAKSKGHLQQLTDLARQSGDHICTVSNATPLIAELTVGENIALPAMYHFNQTLAQVVARLGDAPDRLGLRAPLDARPSNLSRRDLLRVQLLRGIVQGCGIVLMLSPRPDDVLLARETLDGLERPMRLWVACQERNAGEFLSQDLKTVTTANA